MDYSRFSDAELINLFLSRKAEPEAIRDELFGRYYERFDQRIRAVLHTCGLPYSPSDFYYNEIFLDLYRQVFDLEGFEAILRKYDLSRGEFAKWFLNYVVVNRVRDWLKKLNKATGHKNIDWLREKTKQEHRQLSLNESISKAENGLTLAEIVPAKAESPQELQPQAMDSVINQLPPTQRIILRLLFIAYQEIPENELAHIATELQVSPLDIREKLNMLGEGLRQSAKYEQAELLGLSLACLMQQQDRLQVKLNHVESELEALFPDSELQEDVPAQLRFKDIDHAKQTLAQSYKNKQIGEFEYHQQSLQLNRQHIAKQLDKVMRKKVQLIRADNAGKYLVTPSYKQLAQLLKLAEGTVASRISRTTSSLKDIMDMEENGEKNRMKEVGHIYLRSE